jgi:hypothetical protein
MRARSEADHLFSYCVMLSLLIQSAIRLHPAAGYRKDVQSWGFSDFSFSG